MTNEELAIEIKRYEAIEPKATPAPWVCGGATNEHVLGADLYRDVATTRTLEADKSRTMLEKQMNAELIAISRDLTPALIARVRDLERVVAEVADLSRGIGRNPQRAWVIIDLLREVLDLSRTPQSGEDANKK